MTIAVDDAMIESCVRKNTPDENLPALAHCKQTVLEFRKYKGQCCIECKRRHRAGKRHNGRKPRK